ncbi:MAG TPA: branched-chain amino acid ABC transporter permease [Syntrophorhabdales bacterium]|nr:branched-chain amino acid ABC transporter permease [Syntrophorhabdales bacterium]
MAFVLTQTINGIVFGMLLFLLAAGLTLMLGTMRIVNLAHGSFYLLGGYIGYTVAQRTHNFLLACLAGLLSIAILGVLTYKTVLEKRFAKETLAQVLLTFGMLLIISDVCRWIWGGNPLAIPKPEMLQGTIYLGSIVVPLYRLAVIIIGVVILLFLWWFQEKTKYGAIVRAGVDDAEMAQGIGINISLVKTLVFSMGALLAGLAGVIGGPFVGLSVGLDIEILLLAIVVVIIGGMGSLRGALVGALLIGLIDSFGKSLLPELSIFTLFAAMVVVLALKPSGLFGTR